MLFFFSSRRRHTRFSRDWSSDVCSSDLAQGRRLPRLLREAGLSGVRADAYFPLAAPECAALESATMRLVRDRLVGAGIATAQDVDRHLANVAAGALDLSTAPLVAAWGRKP